ncbi:MAG: hypothetical protein B6I22_13290 [Desulfobacteraceae bacterium 4572_123]|nr:MAG: hypothetical protein B6I22_13290 [Desulfobacteraceae bacterium 4572_123]
MQPKKTTTLVMGLIFLMLFCPLVWADGGMEPQSLSNLPNPPIYGSFTATYGAFKDGKPTRFKIHAILKCRQLIEGEFVMVRRQFFLEREVTEGSYPICDYTDYDLLRKYTKAPELQEAAIEFDLPGSPRLVEVRVLEQGDCDNPRGAFIKGSLLIQVKKPSQ